MKLNKEIEEKCCELYKNKYLIQDIAKELGINRTSVRNVLKRNNVYKRISYEDIVSQYCSGIGAKKIAENFNCNKATIYKILKKYNISARGNEISNRTYKLNDTWLDSIDTEEKAYFLGWMWSDGNVYGNKFKIALNEIDKEILQKFSHIFYGVDRISLARYKGYKEGTCAILRVCSKKLSTNLKNLGCMPRKTFKIKYPTWIDSNLEKHFIRGLLDGDGYICVENQPMIGYGGTKELLLSMQSVFQKHLNITTNKMYKNKTIFAFDITGYEKIKKFLNWIYIDSTIYLQRKYNKYQDFLKMYNVYCETHYTSNDILQYKEEYKTAKSWKEVSIRFNIPYSSLLRVLKRKN